MPARADRLQELATAVADGRPIDWGVEESSAGLAEKAIIAQLHVLSRLAQIHRGIAPPSADRNGLLSPSSPVTPSSPVMLSGAPAKGPPSESATTRHGWTGAVWAHLEIIELVGRGSFGAVYRAWDRRLDREVALKLLHRPDFDATGESWVINEGRILARVRHPNVITIYGADFADGNIGLWMEYVHGSTLKQIVADRGVFGAREAALVGLDLARALAAVHAAGLVHRDVKAQNVMRERGGRVVLMDFGTGVDTTELGESDRLVGTPLYMAPELLDHAPATPQSDLYSLGVLLFFLATGTFPVTGGTMTEVKQAHETGQRRRIRDLRPETTADFVQVVDRLLEVAPADRFQSAGALEAALDRVVRRAPPAERTLPTRWPWAVAALSAILVAALVLASTPLRDRILRIGGGGNVRSIAVLPIANLSGDASLEYFADGLTDLLISELSRVSSLQVTSRTSSMVYKGGGKRLGDIAGELHVDAVLEASMMHVGNQLRIIANLRRSDDARLWGETYDGALADAPRLQAQIASAVAASLGLETPREGGGLERRYSARQDAQELYLRGRYLLYQANRDRVREACEAFERAVAIDQRYALAWASLARCRVLREEYGDIAAAEARTLVYEAADRAIAEDASLAEAHVAAAEAKFKFDRDWAAARASYTRALALNPSYGHGRTQYARFLSAAGLVDEAGDQARRAEEIDPLSAEVKATVAMMLYYQRRYADAVTFSERALALNPRIGHTVRGRALAALGRFPDAIAALTEAMTLSGRNPSLVAELGRTYAAAGLREQAEAVLAELLNQGSGPAVAGAPPDGIAYLHAALGRPEEAMAWLERALDEQTAAILWLRVDPRADSLRAQPRFAALLQRIGHLP